MAGYTDTPPVAVVGVVGLVREMIDHAPAALVGVAAVLPLVVNATAAPVARVATVGRVPRQLVLTPAPAAGIALAAAVPAAVVVSRARVGAVAVSADPGLVVVRTRAPVAAMAVAPALPAALAGAAAPLMHVAVAGRVPAAQALHAAPGASVSLAGRVPAVVAAHAPPVARVGVSANLPAVVVSALAPLARVFVQAVAPLGAGPAGVQTVVVSARHFGLSTDSRAFLAVLEHAGVVYGLLPDGLYRLEGETDAGSAIAAALQLGQLGFGGAQSMFASRADVLAEAPDGLVLTTLTDDHGKRREVTYTKGPWADTGVRGVRVTLARAVRGSRWGFRLENRDGGPLAVKGFEVWAQKTWREK